MKLGPSSTTDHVISDPLRIHMQNCNEYVSSKLTKFERYIVWRYTIGSGSVNRYLISKNISNDSLYWTYLFFKYWDNTVKKLSDVEESEYYSYELPEDFGIFFDNFKDPESYLKLSYTNRKDIAKKIIELYIVNLQRIILNSPDVLDDGFHVYKVASKYDGLPQTNINFQPTNLKQLPFNSTTYSKEFNFIPFINPNVDSVLFDIHVSKHCKILYVPELYHAYGFERELIMPKDCFFDIYNYDIGELNYITVDSVNINELQEKKNISMGSVYEINEYMPCKNSQCEVFSEYFNFLISNYKNPL